MRQSKLSEQMIKRPLLLAIVATFAVACTAESDSRVGAAGSAGVADAQDAPRPADIKDTLVQHEEWSTYKDFTFNFGSDELQRSDAAKVREIAGHLEQNPSLRVGIDGPNERRAGNVRDALIDAGVPAAKIRIGNFSDAQLRTDGRVDILVTS